MTDKLKLNQEIYQLTLEEQKISKEISRLKTERNNLEKLNPSFDLNNLLDPCFK